MTDYEFSFEVCDTEFVEKRGGIIEFIAYYMRETPWNIGNFDSLIKGFMKTAEKDGIEKVFEKIASMLHTNIYVINAFTANKNNVIDFQTVKKFSDTGVSFSGIRKYDNMVNFYLLRYPDNKYAMILNDIGLYCGTKWLTFPTLTFKDYGTSTHTNFPFFKINHGEHRWVSEGIYEKTKVI